MRERVPELGREASSEREYLLERGRDEPFRDTEARSFFQDRVLMRDDKSKARAVLRSRFMSAHASPGLPLRQSKVRPFLRANALSLAALSLFAISLVGQILTGHQVTTAEARAHGAAILTLGQYLTSGDFIEAMFENWESEFLQMALFVVMTKYLRQRGSSESKPFGEADPVDEDPRKHAQDPKAPWPVRRGGWVLAIYERSLSLTLLLLFACSIVLHAAGGAAKHNVDAVRHGEATVSTLGYMATAQFWFESFQNWQSEFLSIAVLILLSIVLRERGSSQSKPVAAPHAQTGE